MDKKHQQWLEAKRETSLIVDKLGLPVDKDIADTVTVLRLLGFKTTGSCSGHVLRNTSGPYVVFESPRAIRYAALANRVENPSLDQAYKRFRKKAIYYSALEQQKLIIYLDAFYRDRPLDYPHHLLIQSMPLTYNSLKCQGAEAAVAAPRKERKEILAKNQAEMKAFTEYLKQQYFAER